MSRYSAQLRLTGGTLFEHAVTIVDLHTAKSDYEARVQASSLAKATKSRLRMFVTDCVVLGVWEGTRSVQLE